MSERSLVADRESQVSQQTVAVNGEVGEFLRSKLQIVDGESTSVAADVLVPWFCDVLISEHSIRGYATDLSEFGKQMLSCGITAFEVTADHVKVYKAALLKAGIRPATLPQTSNARVTMSGKRPP